MPYDPNSGFPNSGFPKKPNDDYINPNSLVTKPPDSLNTNQTPPPIQTASSPSASSPSASSQSLGDDWSEVTHDLLNTLPRPWTRGLLYLLVICAGTLLPWSMLSKVDETGSARGRIEPKGKTIRLDAPVSGTVAALKVKEGEIVKAGQILLELESDLVRAELEQLHQRQTGQQNRLAQLEILKNQLMLGLHTQQQQNQAQELEKQVQVEQAKYNLDSLKNIHNLQKDEKLAQINQVKQSIESSQATYKLALIRLSAAQERLPRYKQAFEQGVISQDRFIEAEQLVKENYQSVVQAQSDILQAKSRLKEHQGGYERIIHEAKADIQQAELRLKEQKRSYQSLVQGSKLAMLKIEEQLKNLETEITTLQAEIAQAKTQIKSLEFQLEQRVLKAPATGTVFHLPIQGAGDVVQPGEVIVEIAPENSSLVLRAQIATTESGSLQVGMPVKMKFDAYPFQNYGVLKGNLSWISPDSKMTETNQGKLESFELEIELEKPYIEAQDKKITLTPGQTATAEVIVRQRRVIDFVLDPFKKLQKSGLEL
ncbi:HlyD family efflux transporter periplasmic adaptor subunit [Moorena producens JHB]|uniref:HlyD family efflux transporter periplasmic adaptor subunit n=1 Tax=Moorena producens (strain JHB) TaxID=1454205 RepID=A0A1D9G907_MOOP1|nr:HlyD family efflux transporter periplasmic adaptor subunit [Moorena producens]AOY84117.1 HlyD family efflux transporter periplasmic adaptor subunit [Moorena producens JHB]